VKSTGDRGDLEIDWGRLKTRVDRAVAYSEETDRLSPERARLLMDERARALASTGEQKDVGATVEVVTFSLSKELYGIETRYVWEVVRLVDFTPVPGAPEFIMGLTSLRGEILAIVDLRTFFGATRKGLSDLSRLLVLGTEGAEFGIMADRLLEIITLEVDQIYDPSRFVSGDGREYLKGVTNEALILLDGDVLIRDRRLYVGGR
jgi:purine-binding chemotaxis protein CheW